MQIQAVALTAEEALSCRGPAEDLNSRKEMPLGHCPCLLPAFLTRLRAGSGPSLPRAPQLCSVPSRVTQLV